MINYSTLISDRRKLLRYKSFLQKYFTIIFFYNNTSTYLMKRIAIPKGMKQLQKPGILDDMVRFQRRSSQCSKAPSNKSKIRRSNQQIKNQEKQSYPVTFIKINSVKEENQRQPLDQTLDNHSSYSLNLMRMKNSMLLCNQNSSIKQSRSVNVTQILQRSDLQLESKSNILENKQCQRLNALLKKKNEECAKYKLKLNQAQKQLYQFLVKVEQMNGQIYSLNLKQHLLAKEADKNKKIIQQLKHSNKQLQEILYSSEQNLKIVKQKLSNLEVKLQQNHVITLEQKLQQKQQLLFEAINEIKSLQLQVRCQNFKFDKEKVRIYNEQNARYNLLNTSFKKFKERIVNTPSNQNSVKQIKSDLFSSDTELEISLDEDYQE